ncbi:EAL domain-containing protein [Komagataeibacter kakiaceti JCM 25156]
MQMRELTALTADILLPALQQAIDAIVIFDERNEIVFYNAAAEALWGRPRAEVMGRDVACLIPLCIRHEHARNASRAAGGELNQMLDTTREIAFSRADGEYVCGELSLSRVRMGDGGQVYYVGVVRNITEETRRARILNLQAEVIQALTGDMPLDDIGHLICRKVESFLPDSIATLMFVEEEHTHWRVISTPALPPRIRDALESTVPTRADRETLVTTPSHAGRLAWDNCQSICRSLGLRSCYATPVQAADGQVVGVFALYLRQSNRFGSWPQRLVGACAPFCALALERQATRAQITQLARHDSLTGLLNRGALHHVLADMIAGAVNRSFAVFMIDINRFRDINDTLGHVLADQCLIEIAIRLRAVARGDCVISRSGGDEFVVVVPDCAGEKIPAMAHELLATLGRPLHIDHNKLTLTCSIGISTFPLNGPDSESLLGHADTAMRQARRDRRGGFRMAIPARNHMAQDRLVLGAALRDSLAHGLLHLHYQPQVRTGTLALSGVEALARWHHPRLGDIFPTRFIAVAEETGQVEAIGHWALGEACRQMALWDREGVHVPTIAVNLSAVHFRDRSLPAYIAGLLGEHDLKPARLTVEITESVMMGNHPDTAEVLQSIRNLGCGLSMDDFGTGYSSLSRLTHLPLTEIKMDRSFITNLEHDRNERAVAMAVIEIGRRLGMTVVTEGVETLRQCALLEELHCDVMQGYLFGEALTADEMVQWVRRGGAAAALACSATSASRPAGTKIIPAAAPPPVNPPTAIRP